MIDIATRNAHTLLLTFRCGWTSQHLLHAVQDAAIIAAQTPGKKFVVADLRDGDELPEDLRASFPALAKARAPFSVVSRRVAVVTMRPWILTLNGVLFAKVYDQSFVYFTTGVDAYNAVDSWHQALLGTGMLPLPSVIRPNNSNYSADTLSS